MDAESVKKSAVSGVFWKIGERVLAQGVSFVVSLILARLLMPEDYGVISILTIFITLANVFVTDGFSAALIQKKDCDSLDYSSVLFASLAVSLLLYGLIFISAPFIAGFYNMPILSPTLRVLAIRIPLAAVNSVEIAYLSRKMQFKKFFWATFIGTAGSAVVGIAMALGGLGVWALVGQNLFNYTVDSLVLALLIKRVPPLKISFDRIKTLMSYGYKILLTSLFFSIIQQLRSLIIGKKYSAEDLAFYSKGKHFPELISTNTTGPIATVLFPTISKFQSDMDAVKNIMRKCVGIITYTVTPLMLGFAAIAEPFVRYVLTEKWLPCVPYIWIGCIYYIFVPINSVNLEAVKAVGKSDAVLSYGIMKRVVGVIALLVTMPFGVAAIAWSLVASAVFSTAINAYQNKMLFGYTYKEQLADMIPNILYASCMSVVVVLVGQVLPLHDVLIMLVQVILGIAIYLLLSIITGNKNLRILYNLIARKNNSQKE